MKKIWIDDWRVVAAMLLVVLAPLSLIGCEQGSGSEVDAGRCRDVLERLGVDLRIPANEK